LQLTIAKEKGYGKAGKLLGRNEPDFQHNESKKKPTRGLSIPRKDQSKKRSFPRVKNNETRKGAREPERTVRELPKVKPGRSRNRLTTSAHFKKSFEMRKSGEGLAKK